MVSAKTRSVYVELGVGMATEQGAAVWCFDADLWGRCWQGSDEAEAIAAMSCSVEEIPIVRERVHGDELAFDRDYHPASVAEREATLAILATSRQHTLGLIASTPDHVLDYDDPGRIMPDFASWRTLRQMAWHIADTESRYYLPSLGLPDRPPENNLMDELEASADWVRQKLLEIPSDLATSSEAEQWTTTKLFRRLAWHERSELVTMYDLAKRYSQIR